MTLSSILALGAPILLFGIGPHEGPPPTRSPAADSLSRPALRAARIHGSPPRMDGRLDDGIWAETEVADGFVQAEPSPGSPATERTEVRVLRSGDALYVGARLFDSSPGEIRAPLARRDEDVVSDWFVVYLDPGGERSGAVAFAVNPRGVKRDFLILEDGREDPDWQAIWDVAVDVDAAGWSVELRIPLSQLRFAGSPGGGEGNGWGVNFERRVARTGEVASWIQLPRNRRQILSSFGDLTGMEGVRADLRLELVPYSVARVTAPGGPTGEPGSVFGTVGADARLGLPASLTLTATFNPDFGQVEADPAVVNVSGYRTFFPEKRPFFLEDRELLAHDLGRTRIFHSRRIGRDVDPGAGTRSSLQRVPDASGILAASKLSGRTPGGWSLGVLHAVTNAELLVTTDSVGVEEFEPVEPRTNYLVARVERTVSEGKGAVGGLFTLTHRGLSGDLQDDLVARALVGGGTWRRHSEDGAHHFSAALFGSQVEGTPEVLQTLQTAHGRYLQRPDASHLHFDPERTRLAGFGGEVSAARVGPGGWTWGVGGQFLSPGFEVNDLGYQREADHAHQYAQVGYDLLGQGLLLRRRRLILTQWSDWTFGGERMGLGGRADLQLQARNFWGAVLQVEHHLPHLSPDHLRGGPALRMPGSTRRRAVLYTDPRRSVTLRLDGSLMEEEETGGRLQVLRATLGARPTGVAHVTLEPSLVERTGALEYVTRRSTGEGEHFLFGEVDQRTVSLIGRLDLAFTPTLSLQLYAQPYLVTRRVDGYREVADPRAPRLDGRFRTYEPGAVRRDPEGSGVEVDRTGDGEPDLGFPDPSFTYGQLSSNVVLRWEYRPASTLFLVWGHDFRDRASAGSYQPVQGMADLLGLGRPRDLPATNIFLVKLTYWFSP